MEQRILGKTGLKMSVIGVGTWQLSGEWGVNFVQDEVDAILDTAAECGINLIDTAQCYGPDHLAERMIGDYLSRRDRSRWILATKFGHEWTGHLTRNKDYSAAAAQQQLEASLRALRTDYIDLYQFHSGPDEAFRSAELWQYLRDQQSRGVVRGLGVSINSTSTIQAEEADHYGIGAIQVVYNRLEERSELVHFPAARRDGLGVLARVPLASGLLSGKYGQGVRFRSNDPRSRLSEEELNRQLLQVEELQMHEVPPEIPMAQWAIAWCLSNPVVTAVIPGCKSPAQVRSNAAAADLL